MTGQVISFPALWTAFRAKVIGRKFVRDVGALTIANGVAAVISLMQGILVARWLGPQLYGVAALVMSYPSLVYTFFDARSSEASVKYLSEFHARGERERALAVCKLGYVVDVTIAAVAFIVVLLTAPWAARNIAHEPEAVGLIVVYAATLVPNGLVSTAHATLATLGRFSLIASINTLTAFLRTAMVLGLVATGWQISGVVWGNVIATAVTGILYGICAWVLTHRVWGAFPLQGSWQALRGRVRDIAGLFVLNELNVLLDMIPKYMDLILLGYFRGPTETGYYKLAKNFAGGLSHLTRPLQSVAYPKLARLWNAGLLEDFRKALYNFVVILGIPLILVLILCVLTIPSLIFYMLDTPYLMASSAAQLLLIVTGVRLIGFWIRPLYLVMGRIRLLTTFALVGAIVTIPVYVSSIWLCGFQGLAISRVGLAIVTDIIAGVVGILLTIENDHGTWKSDGKTIIRKDRNLL
jgi:O-antigen/teichoic acid export membrane protein